MSVSKHNSNFLLGKYDLSRKLPSTLGRSYSVNFAEYTGKAYVVYISNDQLSNRVQILTLSPPFWHFHLAPDPPHLPETSFDLLYIYKKSLRKPEFFFQFSLQKKKFCASEHYGLQLQCVAQ